ncbi:carbamate kinase [Halobacteriaceae archaeon GCM10025711]
MRIVAALGGNTLLERGEGTIADQRDRVRRAADDLEALADQGHDLVFTHGNGPQVGHLLLQQEHAPGPDMPLDVLVAETQAQIGYLLQQELDNRFDDRVLTVVTQVVVDADDPAFDDPTKPVGPFYTEAEAGEKPFETREVKRGAGETAFRRVVPSPRPVEVVEAGHVRSLVDRGASVVCAGGGGVPVVAEDGALRGVEAVVDKDRTSRVLADAIDADALLVLTDVPNASLDYGGPDERPIGEVDATTLCEYADRGEFEAGSMGPKVEACLAFVEGGGDLAVITSPEQAAEALRGDAGTRVVPD